MPKLIGVANTSPVYRLGLAGALNQKDFLLEEVTDPVVWMSEHEDATILIGVRDTSDLEVVVDLTRSANRAVMTVVDEGEPSLIRASLEAGASGAFADCATPGEITIAIEAAMLDQAVLPSTMVRDMCRALHATMLTLGEPELSLFRGLARGETIAEVAQANGYSEREVYRRLRHAYETLGVTSRIEALLKLAKAGLLD